MAMNYPTHQVAVFVFQKTRAGHRYLIVRRSDQQESLWRPVLGTVRPEEMIETAAVREVRSETGIIGPSALIDFGFRHRERAGDLELVDWGVGYDVGRTRPRIQLGRDCGDYRWLEFEKAYRMIEFAPFQEGVLKLHLRLVG